MANLLEGLPGTERTLEEIRLHQQEHEPKDGLTDRRLTRHLVLNGLRELRLPIKEVS